MSFVYFAMLGSAYALVSVLMGNLRALGLGCKGKNLIQRTCFAHELISIILQCYLWLLPRELLV